MMCDSMLKYFLCFIMMLLPISVISQVQKNGSSLYPTLESQREPLYTEIRTLHHSSEDSMTILAMFRIQYDALLFEKSTSFRGGYVAFPSLEIESKDSNGIIKSRIQWKDFHKSPVSRPLSRKNCSCLRFPNSYDGYRREWVPRQI